MNKLKKIFFLIGMVLMAGYPFNVNGAVSISDYTAAPPFVSEVVEPNVMIIQSTGSTMLNPAYCEAGKMRQFGTMSGSTFKISGIFCEEDMPVADRGTAQAGAASTITLASTASITTDAYKDYNIYILSGTGAGAKKTISAYNGTTKVATISGGWSTNPDNTSKYVVSKDSEWGKAHDLTKDYYGFFKGDAETDGDSTADTRYMTTDSNGNYLASNGNDARYFRIATAGLSDNLTWSGNFLNWLTMRRIDVVRRALVGGRGKCEGTKCEDISNPSFLVGLDSEFPKTPPGGVKWYHEVEKTSRTKTEDAGYRIVRYVKEKAVGDKEISPYTANKICFAMKDAKLYVRTADFSGGRDTSVEACHISDDGVLYDKDGDGIANEYVSSDPDWAFANDGTDCKDSQEDEECTDSIYNDMHRLKVWVDSVGTDDLGIVQKVAKNIRFGLGFYRKDDKVPAKNDGAEILIPVDFYNNKVTVFDKSSNAYHVKHLTALIHQIMGLKLRVSAGGSTIIEDKDSKPKSWSPVAEGLWTAVGYFQQSTTNTAGPCAAVSDSDPCGPHYYDVSKGQPAGQFNYYWAYQYGKYTGTWQNDSSKPSVSGWTYYYNFDPYYFTKDDDGDGILQSTEKDKAVPCCKSFVLIVTDANSSYDQNLPSTERTAIPDASNKGDANKPSCTPPPNQADAINSCGSGFVDDIAYWAHTNDLRPDLSGTQTLSTYILYAFGAGSQLVKDVAKYGAFEDSNGNNLPDLSSEWDKDGDGKPDNYYEAQEGSKLESALTSAINDILKNASSGTSVSVLTTSASGAGNIFQCYFLPVKTVANNNITWLGHLLELGVSAKGEILDNAGKVISFSYNSSEGQTYVNITGGGNYPLIEWTGYKWDAGEKLVTKTATSRTIKIFVDADKDGIADSGEYVDFTDTNKTALRPYLRAATDTESANIINFIRGSSISGYRDRTYSGTNQYKLSDIVYSTPTVVGSPAENYGLVYGDKTYSAFFESNKNRATTIFIGGNDGMLHAFDTNGNELWAFIPQNLLPHLKWLTDPDYSHVYYVDLRARVTDINFGDTSSPNWKTVLIGGMRLGGGQISVTDNFGAGSETRNFQSSYFALDITNPNSPNLLWEFTHSDLGFTTSYPAIAKVGNKWFIVVGSGPKSSYVPDYTGASVQSGKIFILNAANTGAWTENTTYWIKDTNAILDPDINTAFMGDPLAVDIDFKNNNNSSDLTQTYNTEVIYIGMTYDSGGTPKWRGNLYHLVINGNVNPGSWSLYTLFDGNAFSSATPITTSPAATVDELDNLWVYFGAGRFYSQDDKSTTTKHAFFGIRDSYWDGSSWKPCWDRNNSVWSTDTKCTTSGIASTLSLYNAGDVTQVVADEGTVTSTAWGSISWDTFVQNVSATSTYRGWYAELAAGSTGVGAERVITKPGIIGGSLLFTTFIPQSDICSYGGTSNLYSLYYKTGTAYKESTIGTTTSGSQTVVLKSTNLGLGMASSPAIHVGQEEGGTAKAFIQTSTGEIKEVSYQLSLIRSGVVSWREL